MVMEDGGRVEGAYAAPGANQDPWLESSSQGNAPGGSQDVTIAYHLHGSGQTKLLLIAGLACGHAFWGPYIRALTSSRSHETGSSSQEQEDLVGVSAGPKLQLCAFDNRGVGSSTVPKEKSKYSTTIMAKDALALMDHLNWDKAHVCGHSMGAMIALKLAAMAPGRVLSLTLISVTGGGYQCLPKLHWRTFAIAYRFLTAKTLEERIAVDLDTHYTEDYLEAIVDESRRRDLLFKEYLKNMEGGGMQPKHGLNGHMHACWTHGVKDIDVQRLLDARILVAVIHGRHDVVAQLVHARRLAKRLKPLSRMFELHAGHLVTHQNTEEVLRILLNIISATSSNTKPWDWGRDVLEEPEPLSTKMLSCLFITIVLLWTLLICLLLLL